MEEFSVLLTFVRFANGQRLLADAEEEYKTLPVGWLGHNLEHIEH